ncbi:hypothetical protein OF83DRAFT_48140 [Amylostereum chailletii]|nr:hypothetical protein OF83DRAFT_48140 [Amylostereum chailletii]
MTTAHKRDNYKAVNNTTTKSRRDPDNEGHCDHSQRQHWRHFAAVQPFLTRSRQAKDTVRFPQGTCVQAFHGLALSSFPHRSNMSSKEGSYSGLEHLIFQGTTRVLFSIVFALFKYHLSLS